MNKVKDYDGTWGDYKVDCIGDGGRALSDLGRYNFILFLKLQLMGSIHYAVLLGG